MDRFGSSILMTELYCQLPNITITEFCTNAGINAYRHGPPSVRLL